MASTAPRKVGFLMKLWDEKPEILGSTVMMLIGLAVGTGSLYAYTLKDGDNKKYKMEYIVMRPDDPRVAKIRKHSQLDNS